MPKFNLYEDADLEIGSTPLRSRCEVGWSRGRDVQLAVTRLGAGFDDGVEYAVMPSYDAKGMNLNYPAAGAGTPLPEGDGNVRVDAWQGFHMRVTRPQINELIRTLREARDAAYGRDE